MKSSDWQYSWRNDTKRIGCVISTICVGTNRINNSNEIVRSRFSLITAIITVGNTHSSIRIYFASHKINQI